MRLEEITDIASLTLKRDGTFESLGLLHNHRPRMLAFVETEGFLTALLENPCISCVITDPRLAESIPVTLAVATCAAPRIAFYELHNYLAEHTDFYGGEFRSQIHPESTVHPRAYVDVNNVRIGRGAVIEPNVTVLAGTVLGENVILRAGCTIGSQGFEFKRAGKRVFGVAHTGGVHLRDRVEIQANSTVDSAIFGDYTEIGEDTKINNLVYVAHCVRIGKRCLVAAGASLCGSSSIGDDVYIGPGAVISNRIQVGNNGRVTIGAVVTKNVGPGGHVTGNLAIEHARYVQFLKSIR